MYFLFKVLFLILCFILDSIYVILGFYFYVILYFIFSYLLLLALLFIVFVFVPVKWKTDIYGFVWSIQNLYSTHWSVDIVCLM